MSTIQISNYYLTTSLKPKAAQERLREAIFDFIDQSDIDSGFNIDLFIEDLANVEEPVFQIADEGEVDTIDIEMSDEDVDNIIQDYIELHEAEDIDDYDDIDEDGYDEDYAEDEPEIFSDEED